MSDLQPFVRKLETEGVDVDSTMNIGVDPSLMYWYDEDCHTRDIATIALTVAKVPSVINNVLSVTAITTEGGEDTRVGMFRVERETIRKYRDDRITKKEYIQRVADTWENPWGDS